MLLMVEKLMEFVVLFINMQKLIINTRKIMIKIKSLRILIIAM